MTKVVFGPGESRTKDEMPEPEATALWRLGVAGGQPYAWALAADGEAGVAKVINLFREELQNAMLATGCVKVGDIDRSLIA